MSPPEVPLTLMAVHAHPDDEASSTGGILAKYSAEGIRTILVTCTNGELGDGPDGTKPGEPGHDEAMVSEMRLRELRESCRILGVSELDLLGYHDSGLMGWPGNDAADAFWQMSVDVAAAPLAALMERHRPHVVVTYDAFGFYGHPDHIQAHRITLAAIEQSGIDPRVYFPTIRRSRLPAFGEAMVEAGLDPPQFDVDRFGSPDEDIAATIDCRDYAAAKLAALRAHESQKENIFFVRFDIEQFSRLFGTEEFVCFQDPTRTVAVIDDLFAGLSPERSQQH